MGHYPISLRALFKLVKKAVTETKTARKGVRRSGFQLGGTSGIVLGEAALTLPPCAYTEPEGGGGGPGPDDFLAKYVSQDSYVLGGIQDSVVVVGMDSSVWVRGEQPYGQFGLGHTDSVEDWTEVTGLPEIRKAVYIGQAIYFLTEGGSLYGAGLNDLSTIDPLTTDDQLTPVAIDVPEGVVDFEGTAARTLHVLTDGGEVYSWGAAGPGQIGDGYTGSPRFFTTPTLNVNAGDDNEQIACGHNFTLLRKTDGSVEGFGYWGTAGEISWYFPPPDTSYTPTPVVLPLSNPDCVDLTAGGYCALYVYGDGTAQISDRTGAEHFAWENATPQIADFHNGGGGSPTFYGDVLGVEDAVKGWTRENGAGFALLMADGSLFSFGLNVRHDLGNGTDVDGDVGFIQDWYKKGTTLLAQDTISFSGNSAAPGSEEIGTYYAVLSDGTLLSWKDSDPEAINGLIG